MNYVTLNLARRPQAERLRQIVRKLERVGPPSDHRGCCRCAVCGEVDLLECEPVGVELVLRGVQLRGTNICPACAVELEAAARADASARLTLAEDEE